MRTVSCLILLVCVGCQPDPVAELTAQLKHNDPKIRKAAVRALLELGKQAAAAIPDLAHAVLDSNGEVRRLSCVALGNMGPIANSALANLQQALDDRELPVRLQAAFALQKIDPANEAYVPQLSQAMVMGDGGVIVAVGNMSPSPTWATPALLTLLNDERPGIRRLAAQTLGRLKPLSEEVRSALTSALQDQNDQVREAARTALGTG